MYALCVFKFFIIALKRKFKRPKHKSLLLKIQSFRIENREINKEQRI